MADEIVERLAVELSLESENFRKKITAINSIIKNTEKEFKSAGNGVKNFENTFTGLDAKWSYVNILDTKSQTFLCCTSS